jgi:hypothetical protein
MYWLRDFLSQSNQDNVDELPPFVNHYPDQVSDKIDSHSAIFELGHVSSKDTLLVSTIRELKTIPFALKMHAEEFQGKGIQVYTDYMTALKY